MSTGLEIERLTEDLGPVNKKPERHERVFEPNLCVCPSNLNVRMYYFISREKALTH